MDEMRIEQKRIGAGHAPLIVAEMSGNHGQSLERALCLVDAAAAAGADALKLQTYTADTMTLDLPDEAFVIDDPDSLWQGSSLYDLYQKASTPWDWHQPIFDRARQQGLIAFSSPFDATSVDFLETLDVPCYKIASFENGDLPLIRKAAATGKPLILSTGTATLAELTDAVEAARGAGCRDLILLKCTSRYPTEVTDVHLATIPYLARTFGCPVGVSDHTMGTLVPVAAVALGACVVEKHFTLDRAEGTVDAGFSLEPAELKQLVQDTRLAWQAVGHVCCHPVASEEKSRRHRRSLYAVQDIVAGEPFTARNVRAIRPNAGLPPKYYDQVMAAVAAADIARGTPLRMDMVSG